MAIIVHEKTENWLELSSLIDNYFTHYNTYIFRGQADLKWKLESTLQRRLNTTYKQSSEKTNAIKRHFEQFKENIRGRTNIDLKTSSEEEIWAIGQHFGLNTPLLDWTKSPYVGLFFSLFGNCKSGKRALWALHQSDIYSINENLKRNQINIVNPLTHYNDRLVNQRGLFLNIPIGIDLEKWIQDAPDFEWVTLYKIEYPDSIKSEVISALDNKNINHLSLFPDMYGSSLYSNYQLEIEPYHDLERMKEWN